MFNIIIINNVCRRHAIEATFLLEEQISSNFMGMIRMIGGYNVFSSKQLLVSLVLKDPHNADEFETALKRA